VFSFATDAGGVAHTAEERDRITVEITCWVLLAFPLVIGGIVIAAFLSAALS
jgi:hypothetical protein